MYQAEVRNPENVRGQEGYIKDYIEGRLWFELVAHGFGNGEQVLIWLVEACPNELVATSQPEPNIPKNQSDNAMFVFVRQLAEDAEKFEFRPLRSVIWLKIFNNSLRCSGEKPNILLEKSTEERLGLLRYAQREIDVPLLFLVQGDALVGSMLHGKCPGDVIEGSPKVAQDITDNQSPGETNSRIDLGQVDMDCFGNGARNLARNIQFALSPEGDFWLARGATNSSVKAVDVYIRPLNFEAGTSKWMLRGVQSRHGSRHRRTNAEDPEGRAPIRPSGIAGCG